VPGPAYFGFYSTIVWIVYFSSTRSIICVLAYKCTLCRWEMIRDALDEDESALSGASAKSSIPSTP